MVFKEGKIIMAPLNAEGETGSRQRQLGPYQVFSDNMLSETEGSGVGIQVSVIKKFQITNTKYQIPNKSQ
jgi:hypothetical protein